MKYIFVSCGFGIVDVDISFYIVDQSLSLIAYFIALDICYNYVNFESYSIVTHGELVIESVPLHLDNFVPSNLSTTLFFTSDFFLST